MNPRQVPPKAGAVAVDPLAARRAFFSSLPPSVPSPAQLVQTAHLGERCDAIEVWAESCDSVPQIRDASHKLAAIVQYLARTSREGRARVQAAQRHLEARIGELLGPASKVRTGPGRNAYGASEALTPNERHDFRQMAAHPDVVEAVIAESTDDDPPSRRKVLRVVSEESAEEAFDAAYWAGVDAGEPAPPARPRRPRRVAESAPDPLEEVRAGRLSLERAAEIAEARPKSRRPRYEWRIAWRRTPSARRETRGVRNEASARAQAARKLKFDRVAEVIVERREVGPWSEHGTPVDAEEAP